MAVDSGPRPFQINRVPWAISDVIGGKGWPNNPDNMEPRLQLAYDARDEFLIARARIATATVALGIGAATGQVSGLAMPPAEAWYVYGVAVYSATLAVGDTRRIRVGWGGQLAAAPNVWSWSEASSAAANERVSTGLILNTWAPPNVPGQGVYYTMEAATGAAVSFVFTLLYAPITL